MSGWIEPMMFRERWPLWVRERWPWESGGGSEREQEASERGLVMLASGPAPVAELCAPVTMVVSRSCICICICT